MLQYIFRRYLSQIGARVMQKTNQTKHGKVSYSQLRATRKKLISFFKQNPRFVSCLDSDYDNSEMWEAIFKHFFNATPVDDISRNVPSYYRAGSTDLLWDVLLHKMGALTMHHRIVAQHRKKRLFFSLTLEAA